jgi:hypothetical protein
LGLLAYLVKVAALAMLSAVERLAAVFPVSRRHAKCDQPRLASWRWGRGAFGLAFGVCLDWF